MERHAMSQDSQSRRPGALLLLAGLLALPLPGKAADHTDAQLMALDSGADLNDVYAFVGTRFDNPGQVVLNLIVQSAPFSEPGAAALYGSTPADARVAFRIASDDGFEARVTYVFEFSDAAPTEPPGLPNPATSLAYGIGASTTDLGEVLPDGTRRNFHQFYTVTRIIDGQAEVIGKDLATAPPNLGPNVTPLYNDTLGMAVSGATTFAGLDGYTQAAVHALKTGEVVFAGPREDGFYADIAGLYDLYDQRVFFPSPDFPNTIGQQGGGVDLLKGFNAYTVAIQIPINFIGQFAEQYTAVYFGQEIGSEGVRVWATSERRRVNLRRSAGGPVNSGPWVQVDRVANPMVNLIMNSLGIKDEFNQGNPVDDGRFEASALTPEVAVLINALHSPPIPVISSVDRADLVKLLLPDVLRVDTTTGPVPLPGNAGFNRLAFVGGDTTGGKSSGWPNGRRPGDDVVDILLTAVRSGPDYDPLSLAGDNVNANDQLYNQVFPYLGTPHSGYKHSH